LAWDTCCSAFAGRQILYERFFQADAVRNAVILYNMFDREPMTGWVQDFLNEE
jgi:4-hydroxyphenylacetate 3-monooxygenase